MIRKPLLFILATHIFVNTIQALTPHIEQDNDQLIEAYIRTYHQLAMNEMHRTGVPASITLAQGIIESTYGTSELATRANNHFGIKCGKDWSGAKYYQKTQEQEGNHLVSVPDCFRQYGNASESYADHSNFLLSRLHYKSLFQLSPTDYENWAKGLKDAGYATDMHYASKLISKIEKHNLARFDEAVANPFSEQSISTANIAIVTKENISDLKQRIETLESVLTEAELCKAQLQEEISALRRRISGVEKLQEDTKRDLNQKIALLDETIHNQEQVVILVQGRLQRVESIQQSMLKSDPLSKHFNPDGSAKVQLEMFPVRPKDAAGFFYQNGRKTTTIPTEKSLFNVAAENGIEYRDLLKFNDLEEETKLPEGCYIYLENKASVVEGSENIYHTVQPNETMYVLAQRYGIKISKLYQRNNLKKGEEPEVGEHIFLNKTRDTKPKVKSSTNPQVDFGSGGSKINR